jgi:hypothetical protein
MLKGSSHVLSSGHNPNLTLALLDAAKASANKVSGMVMMSVR